MVNFCAKCSCLFFAMTVINAVDKKTPDLDDVLGKFSIFGRYHRESMALIFIAYMTNNIYCSNYVFAAEDVGYRCADEGQENATCSQNDTCTQWVYDNPNSFVAEFGLACQEWKRTLVGSVHSFGYMAGLLLVGPLSDRLGRKPMAVITGVLGGVFGLARSFTTSYWLYVALEFFESAIGDICSPIFMITIEMVANERRLLYQMLSSYGYTFGSMTLALAAWLVPYWRTLLQVIYAPALFFFLYIYLLDESPRWLLSKGKKEKAVAILKKASKKNQLKLDQSVLEKLSCEEDRGIGFATLLKKTFASKALLLRFFVCLCWWTTSTFVHYGMTINSVSLKGNKYVNFALTSAVDIPGTIAITYILIKFKRKMPLIFTFIAGAAFCLIQPFMPNNLNWLSILLYMTGKFFSSAYFGITYIYTSELFPTYTRNSMHALCSSLGRIGSIVAPQTPLLMHYWPGLPSLVFGAAALLAGLATFLVPDTAGEALPDTVDQAEAIGCKTRIPVKQESDSDNTKDCEKGKDNLAYES